MGKLNTDLIPKHVAIIMDGNGRWAKSRGMQRWEGHKSGIEAVRRVVEAAAEIGIKYLTIYAFSIENWNRPKEEVDMLMELMVDAILKEGETLMKNNVKIKTIGRIEYLPKNVRSKLLGIIERTSINTGIEVIIALSYGSRRELLDAAKGLAKAYKDGSVVDLERFNENDFEQYLATAGVPDPDLLIRTSGEYRISNFLLWQIAYTELYFIDKFWPDFEKEDLYLAIQNFQQRERRYGKTGEQIKK